MAVNSIEEYYEQSNEMGKLYIKEMSEFMYKEFPELHHKLCFSIPMWLVGKKMNEGYIGISTAKNHFSIHFSSDEYILYLKENMRTCKFGRRCINIKYDDSDSFEKIKEYIKEFLNSFIR